MDPLALVNRVEETCCLGMVHTAWRSRNQTQLQRLKPTERNLASAGLKPGPPRRSENSARGATNLRISATEDTDKSHRAPNAEEEE